MTEPAARHALSPSFALDLSPGRRVDALRRAAAELESSGHAADAALARRLYETADAAAADPLRQRDAAIVALAETFAGAGSRWRIAGAVASEIRRYGASAWRRRDHRLAEAPLEYSTNDRKRALFAAMRADAAVIGPKQIDRILASACFQTRILGHEKPVFLSSEGGDLSRSPQTKGRAVNAIVKFSDSDIIAALRDAPSTQAALAAQAARVVAERRKLVDALAALDAQAGRDYPRLDERIQTEVAAHRAAEIALRAAAGKLNAAVLAKSQAVNQYNLARLNLETELRASPAAAAIDAFVREMRDEIDASRRQHEGGWLQDNPPLGGHPVLRGYSNRGSVKSRVDAIFAAIDEAERLRLEPDQSDLALAFAALRAGLPAISPAVKPRTFADMAREGEDKK